MPVIPFAFQCTIQENQLLALKDSVNGRLFTSASNIPDFEYYLSIYPNGNNDERRGQTWVFLYLGLGKVKKAEADFSIFIDSANYSHKIQFTYERSIGRGEDICTTEDFFNQEKKFIVDGKCTIKVYGTFKFENNGDTPSNAVQQKWVGGNLGNGLWKENDSKDFTIVVDGKEIKVHKLVLQTLSDVFRAMFNPETKESIENKVKITDFSFNVVETAVKMIYDCYFASSLSFNEMMSLLQFFDKYQISSLKENVEPLLINQITAATVCRLTNCSIQTNSTNLKNKCMEFLEKSFASKTPLSDIEILDNNVLVTVFQNMVCHTVEIR